MFNLWTLFRWEFSNVDQAGNSFQGTYLGFTIKTILQCFCTENTTPSKQNNYQSSSRKEENIRKMALTRHGVFILSTQKHREIAKSCPEKSHQFLSQFEFSHNLSFEFSHKLKLLVLSQFEFLSCKNFGFWVLSQFEF